MKERPMDFAELKRAYDENRVIVLPAEYVYELTWDAGPGCDLTSCPVTIDGDPQCGLCEYGGQFVYQVKCRQEHIDQIGKTVFLTEEDALKEFGE